MVQGNGLTLVVNLSELCVSIKYKVKTGTKFQVLVDVRLGRSDNEHNRLLQDQKTRKSLRGKECCVFYPIIRFNDTVKYVMYIVNGFIYIGAAVVLLIFHMSGVVSLLVPISIIYDR